MPTLDEPLSLRQLEILVALVDHGSFTAAAEALDLSQSTVSGHIADLERRLAARVVDRGRRGVRPTAVGRVLLGPAREALKSERRARMAVEELAGLTRGTLIVGGSTIPATYLLPVLLARFRDLHPGVRLRLVTGDSNEVEERVLASEVELGVVGREPERPELESLRVAEDRLVLILPPDHEIVARGALEAEAVADLPLVIRAEGSGTLASTLAMLAAAGGPASVGRLSVACEVGSTEAAKAAVRAGLGGAFVSSLAVEEDVAVGALAVVPVTGCDATRAFWAVRRSDAWLAPAARAFHDLLRAGAASSPPS